MGKSPSRFQQSDELFAASLARVREGRGLTLADLAGILADYGWHIPPTGISKIEHLQRRVTVGEAALLAEALGVELRSMITSGDITFTVTV